MAGGKRLVDATDGIDYSFGCDKDSTLSEKHTIRATFRDFEDLPHELGEAIHSMPLSCHGHTWRFRIFPGGSPSSSEDSVHISLYLVCSSDVMASYRFRVPSSGASSKGSDGYFGASSPSWGCKDFAPRSEVLDDFLVDGNLTVEADIQIFTDGPSIWKPKTTLHCDFLKILASGKRSGDVKFQIGDEEFSAHRNILEARAPTLAALAEDYPSDTPIPIQNVDASTFRALLRFVYADDVPEPEQLRREARELLDVADRFGCIGLKLAAEAELAASGIADETAADMILLGDAKNCALLKEAAIDFFAANPAPVMASPGWAKVKESAPLLAELVEVATIGKQRSAPGDSNERDYKRLCVSDLRKKLDEKGLDVDGSRAMLLNRLENEGGDGDVDDSSHEDN